MSDYVYHYHEDGKTLLGWIENGSLFSRETKRNVALVRGHELFSLLGEPLHLYLRGNGIVRGDASVHSTPAAFMELLKS
jgi:hypothetical protein